MTPAIVNWGRTTSGPAFTFHAKVANLPSKRRLSSTASPPTPDAVLNREEHDKMCRDVIDDFERCKRKAIEFLFVVVQGIPARDHWGKAEGTIASIVRGLTPRGSACLGGAAPFTNTAKAVIM